MKTPKPIVAYHVPDAKRRNFPSLNEMYKRLGIASTYANRKLNTGSPCKGWLLYDTNHADTPETREHLRALCPEYDKKIQAIEARNKRKGGYVSVRIDKRTVILVKAEKWTPDYAERYRAKMEATRPQPHSQPFKAFKDMNDKIKPKKRGPGRPRKENP